MNFNLISSLRAKILLWGSGETFAKQVSHVILYRWNKGTLRKVQLWIRCQVLVLQWTTWENRAPTPWIKPCNRILVYTNRVVGEWKVLLNVMQGCFSVLYAHPYITLIFSARSNVVLKSMSTFASTWIRRFCATLIIYASPRNGLHLIQGWYKPNFQIWHWTPIGFAVHPTISAQEMQNLQLYIVLNWKQHTVFQKN